MIPSDDNDSVSLIKRVDQALYNAKLKRNMVKVFEGLN